MSQSKCLVLSVIHLGAIFCLPFQHMLSKVGMWDFDIFLFDRLTNGKLPKRILTKIHTIKWDSFHETQNLFLNMLVFFFFFFLYFHKSIVSQEGPGQGKNKLDKEQGLNLALESWDSFLLTLIIPKELGNHRLDSFFAKILWPR